MQLDRNIKIKISFSNNECDYIALEDIYIKKIKRFNREIYNICKDLDFK